MPPAMAVTLERYDSLRAARDALTVRLYRTLSQRAIDEMATRLGVRDPKRTPGDPDLERAIVLDSALYDYTVPGSGKNAIARFAQQQELSEDERLVLAAMREARVSVLRVTARAVGIGVPVRDVLVGDALLLADRALSEAGEPGDLVSMRVLRLDGFAMSSGVPLGVPRFALTLVERAGVLPATAWAPRPRALVATSLQRLAFGTNDAVKARLATMALTGTDPLCLALGKALTREAPLRRPGRPA